MTGPDAEAWADFETAALEGLSPPVDDLLLNLLAYKRLFVGPWFDRLGGEDAAARAILRGLREETQREAVGAVAALREWNQMQPALYPAAAAAHWTRRRILEDLLRAKESSTEVFLNAAVNAPTDPLRRELMRLADIDRAHAERLRTLIGRRAPSHPAPRETSEGVGAAASRRHPGSLRRNIEIDLESLRSRGVEPVRVLLSEAAIRHVRDEGATDMERGLAFGLPVDVEFGWTGECYAIETRERVRLAELVLSARED